MHTHTHVVEHILTFEDDINKCLREKLLTGAGKKELPKNFVTGLILNESFHFSNFWAKNVNFRSTVTFCVSIIQQLLLSLTFCMKKDPLVLFFWCFYYFMAMMMMLLLSTLQVFWAYIHTHRHTHR